MKSKADLRKQKIESRRKLIDILSVDNVLAQRFNTLTKFSREVRVSEYHVTNACNIRCEGCWFFEYGHDTETKELTDMDRIDEFLQREVERKINCALVIGGEPTLWLDRLKLFVDHFKYVTVSSNGLKPLPVEGFENTTIALTLFGGVGVDDKLRAIKPNGKRFTGLFDKALANYTNDPRAGFVYALTEESIGCMEETVQRIRDNGNRLLLNFYSKYHEEHPSVISEQELLLDKALEMQAKYPDVIASHPYFIRAMITGKSHWGNFGYDNCPSVSVDNIKHMDRLDNGNPVLPKFNTWAADFQTLKFCCTSGNCDGCRDSQAVSSWLLTNMNQFLDSPQRLLEWVELSESYWSQFIWSPYHPHYRPTTMEEVPTIQPLFPEGRPALLN